MIIRVNKNTNYFVASNVPFSDERLTWEARGILGYLLSKPDNWQVNYRDLIKRGPAGDYKVRAALKNLETCGYLVRERRRDAQGKFYWISNIYETPAMLELSTHGLPKPGLPKPGLLPDIVSTDLISTEELSAEPPKDGDENIGQPLPFTAGKNLGRAKSPFTAQMEYFEALFSSLSGLPVPNWDKRPAVVNKLWRQPLRRLLEACRGDQGRTARILQLAINRMRADRLTISSPASVEKVALAIIGEENSHPEQERPNLTAARLAAESAR